MGKRGRAPTYKPEFCPLAYKFCLLGATNEDLADVFGVSRNTIGNWLARYPEFRKAMQDGRGGRFETPSLHCRLLDVAGPLHFPLGR